MMRAGVEPVHPVRRTCADLGGVFNPAALVLNKTKSDALLRILREADGLLQPGQGFQLVA